MDPNFTEERQNAEERLVHRRYPLHYWPFKPYLVTICSLISLHLKTGIDAYGIVVKNAMLINRDDQCIQARIQSLIIE